MTDGDKAPVPMSLVLGPLQGHTWVVESVAFSPDNTMIVSGSIDRTIRIWDAHTGAPIGEPLKGHHGVVKSVVFSSDSNRIASGSDDRTIRIWDARTGIPVGEPLLGHEGGVYSVAFSPDSSLVASGSEDCTVRIWDAQTGGPIGEPLEGHDLEVNSMAFSSDSSRIASGSDDETIRIWDARTGAPVGEPLKGHHGNVNSVVFSPDSSRIASGSGDRTIRIWDAQTGIPIGEPFLGHEDWVRSVAFSPNGSRIVSGSDDATVRIWDARTGAPIGEPLQGHKGWVYSVAFSPDGGRIVSGSEDATVCVWDASQDVPLFDSVSSKMSAQELFECLVRHGCTDLSFAMNPDHYSSSAVARGGFGDVWQGELISGLVVAIKCVWLHTSSGGDWKGMKRAVRETYIWSKARHENVQALTGIIMFQGNLGMVSPWMENGHLQAYLVAHPDVERYPLCVQLASGVSYLHGIDMVHGDLKAVNVLVSSDGVLKITDFDHAIMSSATLRFSRASKDGGGTLRWMAPELLDKVQTEANSESDSMRNKRTDTYALGMTMLEIITGRIPYSGIRNDMTIYRELSKKKPPRRPKELPETDDKANQMWELLLKCWDHDPAARPDAPFILGYLRVLVL